MAKEKEFDDRDLYLVKNRSYILVSFRVHLQTKGSYSPNGASQLCHSIGQRRDVLPELRAHT